MKDKDPSIEEKIGEKSFFDPSRKTVGAIYRDAQIENAKDLEDAQIGDLNREIMKGLVEDLNEAFKSNPFNERPFYVQIYEKWDYQMGKALRRMVNKSLYRPYPEAGTMVWWTSPREQEVRFCWDLPDRPQMINIINSENIYPSQQVQLLKAWERLDLHPFGFMKDIEGNWKENPSWKDQRIKI